VGEAELTVGVVHGERALESAHDNRSTRSLYTSSAWPLPSNGAFG
jgi:hypothetical protein